MTITPLLALFSFLKWMKHLATSSSLLSWLAAGIALGEKEPACEAALACAGGMGGTRTSWIPSPPGCSWSPLGNLHTEAGVCVFHCSYLEILKLCLSPDLIRISTYSASSSMMEMPVLSLPYLSFFKKASSTTPPTDILSSLFSLYTSSRTKFVLLHSQPLVAD